MLFKLFVPNWVFGFTWVSAAIGAGAALGSSAFSIFGQKKTNEEQIDLAREQMAWQEYMSNTAHQREVQDLREAGLNPILSARYGGASTPSGTMPVVSNPYKDVGIDRAVNSSLAVMRQKKELELLDKQNQAQDLQNLLIGNKVPESTFSARMWNYANNALSKTSTTVVDALGTGKKIAKGRMSLTGPVSIGERLIRGKERR